jgi:hypothetical protein
MVEPSGAEDEDFLPIQPAILKHHENPVSFHAILKAALKKENKKDRKN